MVELLGGADLLMITAAEVVKYLHHLRNLRN